MSFSLADAAPLAPPPLDLARLLALPQVSAPAAAAMPTHRFRDASASQCLVIVILGRPHWREAALALGGCFGTEPRQPL